MKHEWGLHPPQDWRLPETIIQQLHDDWQTLKHSTRQTGGMWRIYNPALASVPSLDTNEATTPLINAIRHTLKDDLILWTHGMLGDIPELRQVLTTFNRCRAAWDIERREAHTVTVTPDRDDVVPTIPRVTMNLLEMTQDEYLERWIIAEIARIVYGVEV